MTAAPIIVERSGSLDEFVHRLRSVCYGASLSLSLRVGELLVDQFYEGSLDVWRNRGLQHPSLRQLARRPDLPMSVSSLYRCLAIYELADRIPGLARSQHLASSHVRAVLGLPAHHQRLLLRSAEEQRWSVAELEAAVTRVRQPNGDSATSARVELAPSAGGPARSLRALRRLKLPRISASQLERIAHDELLEIHRCLQALRGQCDELDALVHSHLSACASEPPSRS